MLRSESLKLCHASPKSAAALLQARNLAKFDHVVKERQLQDPEELLKQQADPAYTLKSMSEDTARAMAKLGGADAQKVGRAVAALQQNKRGEQKVSMQRCTCVRASRA